MKKNLLAIVALGAIYSVNAQDTYIIDNVIVKVNPNTLFYNGGNVNVKTSSTTAETEKIINNGNIQIAGNFTNENINGKNFVNKYENPNSYGQLIIKGTSTVTGRIAIEKTNFDYTNNEYFPMGLPFRDEKVSDVFNRLAGSNIFQGDCSLNTNCGFNRYNQTILVWDEKESEYDAVTNSDYTIPGANYTVNIQNGKFFNDFVRNLSSTSLFQVMGKPNNTAVNFEKESGIKNMSKESFSNVVWKDWKNLINNYNETYNSYLGPGAGADTNARYGKNLHRLSNPFTSNLDLSDISIANTWITINTPEGVKAPTEAYDQYVRFKVTKLPLNYTINWSSNTGASNSSLARISAYLQKDDNSSNATPYFWAGNPDALIIKPFEYFEIDYYTLSKNKLGTNIVKANFNIDDKQKTFAQDFSGHSNLSQDGIPGLFGRSQVKSPFINDEKLAAKGLIAGNDFTQVELFLVDDNNIIQGEASYLVNSKSYKTGTVTTQQLLDNPIFLYEEDKDGNVLTNSQTLLNEFNNSDYVGKPIRIGFNNLTIGQTYKINLRLFEHSILNQVQDFSLGKYYLLDKKTNTFSELSTKSQIKFVAEENNNNRFELYWNEKPTTLSTVDIDKSKSTFIYTNNSEKFVRFENNNTTAKIEIFDLNGRLILSNQNINTSSDYKLNLINVPNVYVVVITYKDGKVVTEKTTNK